MPKMFRIAVSALSVVLLLGSPSVRAEDCAAALLEAQRSFREGQLEQALERLKICLEAETAERARAHALIAQIHLEEDDLAQAQTAVEALVDADPNLTPTPGSSWLFQRLLRLEKERRSATLVASVSKVDEPLREAPATVVVVTAEEIARRGYLDLEQVLHDLPGFDISRGNGDVYSNIYMRGYRSDRSDRLLFVIDGVEQNDLHSNTAYISRQYALSNIAQIEVVYGPASTIYGANAFTGVISISTRSPKRLIAEGKKHGVRLDLTAGEFGTEIIDATAAGRTETGNLSWSLTGRIFRSDEPDLSGFADWDYSRLSLPTDEEYIDALRLTGAYAERFIEVGRPFCDIVGLCRIVETPQGQAVELTQSGIDRARGLDAELLGNNLPTDLFSFEDATEDMSLQAEVRVHNFTFGVETWRRDEGTVSWYKDILRTGGGVNRWVPEQTAISLRYDQALRGGVRWSFFTRFKDHSIEDDSSIGYLGTYGGGGLTLAQLVSGSGASPFYQELLMSQSSKQFRSEASLVWQPSDDFYLNAGVELRDGSFQIDFRNSVIRRVPEGILPNLDPPVEEAEKFFPEQQTDARGDFEDLGVYAQASYKPSSKWKLVLGGRFDRRQAQTGDAFLVYDFLPQREIVQGTDPFCEQNSGFPEEADCDLRLRRFNFQDSQDVFNLRAAVIYTHGPWVFKSIYAEAFKESSSFQQFSREPGLRRLPNSALQPEEVNNVELGIFREIGDIGSAEISLYQAEYSDTVALKRLDAGEFDNIFDVTNLDGNFQNAGALRIRGLQAMASMRWKAYDFFANYTYTDPVSTDPRDEVNNPIPGVDELRVGDIAEHRLNFGLSALFRDRYDVHLRANWVGDRQTGVGTTVTTNPFREIDSYFVAHATLGWRGPHGTRLQLIVNNLLDEKYFHPGVQNAGVGFAARLPQPGRAVYFRFSYGR